MRHRKAGVKLNMTSSHKQAMFRNMVTSLFKHDRIRTTDAKAKELRRWADHMVTLAKRGDLHARRQAMSIIREKDVVHKLFDEAAERFGSASGGYTRVIKLGRRPGDAAPVSLIELVTPESRDKKKKPAKKAHTPEKTAEKVAKQEDAQESAVKVAAGAEGEADTVETEAVKTGPEEAADEAQEAPDEEAAAVQPAADQTDKDAPEAAAVDEKDTAASKDKNE